MKIEYKEPNKRELEVGDILVLKNTEDIAWVGNIRMICKSYGKYQLVSLDKNDIIPRLYRSLEEIMEDRDVQETLVDILKRDSVKLVVDQSKIK